MLLARPPGNLVMKSRRCCVSVPSHTRFVGAASGILLAHHGAIVTAPDIAEATYKAVTFERMCRLTADVLLAGRTPVELPDTARGPLKDALRQNAPRVFWEGAVRQLLASEPDVLE